MGTSTWNSNIILSHLTTDISQWMFHLQLNNCFLTWRFVMFIFKLPAAFAQEHSVEHNKKKKNFSLQTNLFNIKKQDSITLEKKFFILKWHFQKILFLIFKNLSISYFVCWLAYLLTEIQFIVYLQKIYS